MDGSPLGKLPGEVRNRIYDHVFTPAEGTDVYFHGSNEVMQQDATTKQLFALSRTCKEIHAQTKGYKLADNTKFRVHNDWYVESLTTPSRPQYLVRDELLAQQYLDKWFDTFDMWHEDMSTKTTLREVEILADGYSHTNNTLFFALTAIIRFFASQATIHGSQTKYTIVFGMPIARARDIRAPPECCTFPLVIPPTQDSEELKKCVRQATEHQRKNLAESKSAGRLTMLQFSVLQAELLSGRGRLLQHLNAAPDRFSP